jgi:hypothetical protein
MGFTGPFAPKKWKKLSIPHGTTAVAPVGDSGTACQFSYKVALGGGGVSERWAVFQTTAPGTGVLTFDYRYEIYHAWFQVTADFVVFAEAEPGEQSLQVIRFVNRETTGPRTFAGSVAIHVEAGRKFGLRIGGSNFDSDSRLEGTLTLSNFAAPAGEAGSARSNAAKPRQRAPQKDAQRAVPEPGPHE